MSRVLLTTDAVGGVWTFSTELSRGLHERGHDVVLAIVGPEPSEAQLAELRDNVEVEHLPGALEWMEDPWSDLARRQRAVAGLVEDHAIDVVHSNDYASVLAPFDAPRVLTAHSCVVTWHRRTRGRQAGPEWARYRRLVGDALTAADIVAAPTRAFLSELLEEHGSRPERSSVVANGLEPTAFARADPEPFVLWTGRAWDPGKGLATLDRAAAGLAWPVVATGPTTGPHGEPVLAEEVELRGHLPRGALKGLLARASIYVSTSRYEPFGLGPLEAALSHTSLVLPRLDTLEEVWGPSATYYAPGRADELHGRLERLIEDPELRAERADAAARRARQHAAGTMADAYELLYEEALSARAEEPATARSPTRRQGAPTEQEGYRSTS